MRILRWMSACTTGWGTASTGSPLAYLSASSLLFARWNGATWSSLGSGMNGSISALAVVGTDLYAGGGAATFSGVDSPFWDHDSLLGVPGVSSRSSWGELKELFSLIKAMRTTSALVGVSKILAHALPNLVPPVDREHTLTFLRGGGGVPTASKRQWELLRELLEGFFYPMIGDKQFAAKSRAWMSARGRSPWDTSALKVVDNLIIGRWI